MENTIAQHITKAPGVCGGKACIAGTRIRVQDIYVWHVQEQRPPAGIVADFPQLTLADVHAALTYYYDNRAEIEQQMWEAEEFVARMKAANPSLLEQRLREREADGDSLPS